MTLVLPATYGMKYSFLKNEFEAQVTQGCWGAEVDFTVQTNGRIRGRIYDAQGNPVGEQFEVSIVTSKSSGNSMNSLESRNEYTDKQGRYEFDGVPPGNYILGVNIAGVPDRDTPYSRIYYPSSSTLAQATIITMVEGQKFDDYDFHLQLPLVARTIAGTVYLQNGKLAVGATVELYDSENPDRSVWGVDAKADSKGHFALRGFKGRRYQLRAFLAEDYLEGTGVQSEMVDVDISPDAAPIKLILSKPGIFRNQK